MGLLETPRRLALMLYDCHPSIKASYFLTQESIDQIERPCFLVFPEDWSPENAGVNQDLGETSYSIAYIGQVFSGSGGVNNFSIEYEVMTRQVAEAATKYLLEHPSMQMSDLRGFNGAPLGGANGVLWMRVDGRSAVSLFTRDGVASEAFWGFTIDVTVKEQLVYNIVGL